jgi:competence protein ComEC
MSARAWPSCCAPQNHALVYDAGPIYASGEDAGSRVVAPFLHGLGIARLDGLIISHDDSDHSGGARSLNASHRPGWLLSSLADPGDGRLSSHGRAIVAEAGNPLVCAAGQRWVWDGVGFEVLYPPARYHANPGFADNDRSCVVRVSSRHASVLMTGDLARLGELSLLEDRRIRLASDILVVGHHGSRSSSSDAFIAAVNPGTALISVGQGNPFGHPDAAVVHRLHAQGARVWRTDRHGALEVRPRQGATEVRPTASIRRRYWHEYAPESVLPGRSEAVKSQLDPQL